MKAWHNDSLEQKIVHNIQQRSLYRTQLLTTDNNVQQCTCISEAYRGLSIMGAVLFQKPFLFKISKDTEAYFKAKITRHGKWKHSPYTVSMLSYETWFCCLTIFTDKSYVINALKRLKCEDTSSCTNNQS
jgi:hypothetical protein